MPKAKEEGKSFQSHDIVLVYKDSNGKKVQVSAQTFKHHMYGDVEIISGEEYYINKAVDLGAKK